MAGRDGWRVEDWVPRTKLLRPEVPRGVAIDPALLGAAARAISATPVTLVAGQAGAGKTTLAAAAVARTGLPVAWASLDPGDDELASLLHLLASAIETVVPDGCTGGRELLRADRPAAADPRRAAGVLVNDLLAVEPALFVLVVDDAHVLTEAGAAPLLDALLAQLPPFLRVVLTARDEPAVALSRLRATRRLAEVGGDDLRLDAAQAEAALNDDIGLGLAPEAISAVVEAVNGWATGVHLLGRSLAHHHGRADGLTAGVDPDALYDYLADEVLGDEPADVVALLEDVAVLSVVTTDAARRLSGRDDAGEVLADLARRLHFLVLTVDRSAGVFRLHDLVRSFLRRRMAGADAAGLAARHRRAADVVDDRAARIEHLIAAGDWDVAADAVEAAAKAFAPRAGDLARVAAWAERIPVERPWLDLARGVAAVGRGDRTGVIDLLGPLVADEDFDDLLGRWLAARTVHMATLDHARWAPEIARLAEHPGFADQPAAVRVDHEVSSAYGAMFSGRWDGARRHTFAAMDLVMATGDVASVEVLAEHLSPLLAFVDDGLDHYETYIGWVAGRGDGDISVARLGLHHQRAIVGLLRGRFAEALDASARGRVVLERLGGSPHLRATFDWAEVSAWVAGGELDRAETLLRRRQEEPAATDLDRHMVLRQLPLWAWVLRLLGRTDEAVVVARRPVADPQYGTGDPAVAVAQASLDAQGAWAGGDLATAIRLLDDVAPLADEIRVAPFGIPVRLTLALAHEAAGDVVAADRETAAALRVAATHGAPGLLAMAGAPAAPLLTRAVARDVADDVARTALAALGTTPAPAPVVVPGTGEVLSVRELDVLRLVAEGASNRQVADALFISEHTVKTHVRHLLAKLDARSRGHAAAVAREHHLV